MEPFRCVLPLLPFLIFFAFKVGRRKNKEEEEPRKGIKDAQMQKFWK